MKELQEIKERLDYISGELLKKQQVDIDSIFYDQQEFCQVMNIHKTTAAQWRRDGIINYSKVGGKFYYRMTDIQKMLDENRN